MYDANNMEFVAFRNLQAAIGCYFDFNAGQIKLPLMQVMGDVTVGEGESVTPNTK